MAAIGSTSTISLTVRTFEPFEVRLKCLSATDEIIKTIVSESFSQPTSFYVDLPLNTRYVEVLDPQDNTVDRWETIFVEEDEMVRSIVVNRGRIDCGEYYVRTNGDGGILS